MDLGPETNLQEVLHLMSLYNVAIVGTGAVGETMVQVLEERRFPVKHLKLLATSRSAGKQVLFRGEQHTVEATEQDSFRGIDIALFAGGKASQEFAHAAVEAGAVVIDNSSTFRLDPEVPLVVPEVNANDAKEHHGIIANPNCSTIIMVVPLKPIYDAVGISRVVVSTYQAVSGAGREAMVELWEQTQDVIFDRPFTPKAFPHQIAFNLIPHIDVFMENGYTKEEMKMVKETQKILHDPDIRISATTVRVPVLRSHSEAINIEINQDISLEEVRELLSQAPGVRVIDNPDQLSYPMPIDASGQDDILVGRLRKDISCSNGLVLWVVGDQLRKGAATNAIQIAELLIS